jgi:hypothetical protein
VPSLSSASLAPTLRRHTPRAPPPPPQALPLLLLGCGARLALSSAAHVATRLLLPAGPGIQDARGGPSGSPTHLLPLPLALVPYAAHLLGFSTWTPRLEAKGAALTRAPAHSPAARVRWRGAHWRPGRVPPTLSPAGAAHPSAALLGRRFEPQQALPARAALCAGLAGADR